ncbi:MAG TPA: RDD family protein [Pirellulales bacterium]|jgi:uncharacterized RDD family membrane protein YckC|nr:RDD family protein [Pirellulales bacterium]
MNKVYVALRGQPSGPFSEEEIRARLATGELALSDSYWSEGMPAWVPLGEWLGWNTTWARPEGMPPLPAEAPRPLGALGAPLAPEAAGPRYAGFWIRVGAALLDGLVLGLFAGVPMTIVMEMYMKPPPQNIRTVAELLAYFVELLPIFVAVSVANFLITWLYYAILESSSRQATLGKMACRLMVYRTDGTRLSFGRATSRFFAKNFISNLLTMGLGFMFCSWTDKKQCLHDLICGTVVIYQKQKQ